MRKLFLKKVQSTQFYPNDWVKPGTIYKNEKRRVISIQPSIYLMSRLQKSILMWFNTNK